MVVKIRGRSMPGPHVGRATLADLSYSRSRARIRPLRSSAPPRRDGETPTQSAAQRSTEEYVLTMPRECVRIGAQGRLLRQRERAPLHTVVGAPVLELVPQAPADDEPVIVVERHVAAVEQPMQDPSSTRGRWRSGARRPSRTGGCATPRARAASAPRPRRTRARRRRGPARGRSPGRDASLPLSSHARGTPARRGSRRRSRGRRSRPFGSSAASLAGARPTVPLGRTAPPRSCSSQVIAVGWGRKEAARSSRPPGPHDPGDEVAP